MAKLLYYGTNGSNDPTKAVFPLLFATVAKEAGHEVEVVLTGEAVYLMQDGVAAATHAVGLPTASDLIQKAVGLGIPIYV
jgi:predicted peroxiredoxin